jgi:hypothetical protein
VRVCLPVISNLHACIESGSRTFMVSVQDILVRVAQGELVRDGWLPAPVWRSPVVCILCRHRLEELALCLWCSTCPRVSSFPTVSYRRPHLIRASSFLAGASRSICYPTWASRSLPSLHLWCPAARDRLVCVWGHLEFGVRLPLRRCCGALTRW